MTESFRERSLSFIYAYKSSRPKILFDVKWMMQCFEVNSFFLLFLSSALNFQDVFSLRFEEMLFTADSL